MERRVLSVSSFRWQLRQLRAYGHSGKHVWGVLLLCALVAGLLLGQAIQLFAYAWPICLPCIGIQ